MPRDPGDTTPEAARIWAEVFRRMPMNRKWRLLEETFVTAKALHAAGVLRIDPQASAAGIHRSWLKTQLGLEVAGELNMPARDTPGSDVPLGGRLDVLREVLGVLSRLGIDYALGGSMASSIHGVARFTLDADVTVEPFAGKEAALAESFGPDYYVSLPAIQDAVRLRSSFNIIHTGAGFKVDIFVRKDEPFEQGAMARRMLVTMSDVPEQPIAVMTPEDVILFKLQWFRRGHEVAGQQLEDVRGVLQAQAGRLDEDYLARWALTLQVDDLLKRVRDDHSGQG